ncbi:hypothetical protein [Citrobacter portucalensis]|uniref:hypothetical protein n=1 Tax=Citrobacter portucalensis TaxID=1639133 RepID=UPI0039FC23E0
MKSVIGALSGLISYTESKKMTMAKIKCHVSNIAFMNMQNESFAYAMQLAEDADKCRSFAAMGNAIQKIITEIERVIDAAHAEALEFNAEVDEVRSGEQWDEWANQHDSRKTEAQKIESDHAEALEIDYCVEAVKEGGGYLGGYVVQNKDASFQILRERSTTGNPLKATYFSEDDYQQGRMKQFCFNGEIPVRLGAAVLAVAELAK